MSNLGMIVMVSYWVGSIVGFTAAATFLRHLIVSDTLEDICRHIADGEELKIRFNTKGYNYDIYTGRYIKGKLIYGVWE